MNEFKMRFKFHFTKYNLLSLRSKNLSKMSNGRPAAFVPSGTVDVLESSVPLQGGLMMPKKKTSTKSTHGQPQASLLGLDRLAEEKRREQRALSGASNESGLGFSKKPELSGQSYRARRLDTPSHPGGVSEDARDRLAAHRSRDKYRGMPLSTP